MFTVMFAIPRTSGWVAQWLEMTQDEETKIARPRQVYSGARERDYQPVANREQKVDPPTGAGATTVIDPAAGGDSAGVGAV
jgi:citrate synthase